VKVVRASAVLLACALVLVLVSEALPYDRRQLDPALGGPLVIEDRHGALLRSVPARDGRPGREHWVPLSRIAAPAVLTLIASEDQRFFEHAGVDPVAVGRALALNAQSLLHGSQLYGASTITMQLARMLHSHDQARTLPQKLYESVVALRIERVLDKQAILEQYLNRAYYGRGAYGIEAAARRYFDKPAAALSTGEATLLCVLPRSPSAYDPTKHLPRALARRDHVLELLVAQGKLTEQAAELARSQAIVLRERTPVDRAPHFVDHVLAELPDAVRAAGGRVHTTLDASLQALLERRVAEHVEGLSSRGVEQAGAVVLDTQRGEVLAMVGSAGYATTKNGQINITTWRRHPGSSLKPFVYATAIEHGDSPATLAYDVYDVPSRYTVRDVPPREHGPARYRRALAGSYNLAAVHVLERVGEARVIDRLRLAGVGALPGDPSDYGLRLALGATKVRLLDLASAYGVFARAGFSRPASSIAHIERHDATRVQLEERSERRVFSPETSALVLDMLADAPARTEVFGHDLPSDLPFPVAVKTGTARGFSDNVAVFLTRELTVAVWNGRFDGAATRGVLGMEGAAPLARAALLAASRGRMLTLPEPPASLVTHEVCALSGMAPTRACNERIAERFALGREPKQPCTFHEHTQSGIRVVYPAELRGWAKRHKQQTREGS
jgi:penicillin-binding protein 1C